LRDRRKIGREPFASNAKEGIVGGRLLFYRSSVISVSLQLNRPARHLPLTHEKKLIRLAAFRALDPLRLGGIFVPCAPKRKRPNLARGKLGLHCTGGSETCVSLVAES
jgi:hypothetical protein